MSVRAAKLIPHFEERRPRIADRFWPLVDRTAGPNGCWPWTGNDVNADGRGRVCIGNERFIAPRVAWALHHGQQIPPHLQANHSCDTPACCNPAHIWVGTQRDNVRDAHAKGRKVAPSPPAVTRCRSGHPFDAENTLVSRGKRVCRACKRARSLLTRSRREERARALGLCAWCTEKADPRTLGHAYPMCPDHWTKRKARALAYWRKGRSV